MTEQIRMLLDLSDVLKGEGASFSDKTIRMLRALAREARDLRELVGTGEDEDDSLGEGPYPRRPHFWDSASGGANPFTISPNPDVHPLGMVFDDVGATAMSEINLPTSAQLAERYDLETEIPHYRFLRTTAYTLRIHAGDDDTIQVGTATATPAGGYVDILADNGVLHLGLFDDRWRQFMPTKWQAST